MARSISSMLESEKLLQNLQSSVRDLRPNIPIAKKHKLPGGHYTRDFLLSDHQTFLDNLASPGIVPNLTSHDAISSAKVTVFGKQDIKKYENSYTPIRIRDLVPGVVNRERIIYAISLIEIASRASLHAVIADESENGGTCKMCIYNTTVENSRQYGKGAKLAILNPYYKKAADGMYLLRVDNPMEIIVLEAPGAPEGCTPSLLPIQHKERGNKLLQEGQLSQALEEYSQAIMGDRHDPFFFSNRSLCYTRLGQFEAALSDATAAAAINPDESKFKYRASMAWSGLDNHQKAVDILQQLVLTGKENASTVELQDRLRVERTYLAQQEGVFNLKGIEELVLAGLSVQMADFIGPLELRKSGVTGCAERGLFATRDIQRGEIIHVSKAAVFLGDYKADNSDTMEFSSGLTLSPPFQILASKLIQKMNKSELFAQRLLNLVEDKRFSKKSPLYTNIDLYTDKGYELIKDLPSPEFSLENIRYIVKKKGIGNTLTGSNNISDVGDLCHQINSNVMKYGLWLIPSLLNHSCVGNVVRVVKGEVCLLKVFKDVKVGEELLISAFDGSFFMSLKERKKSLKLLHGYVCNCVLCKYENEPNITPLLAQVDILFDQVYQLWSKHATTLSTPPSEKYREYATRSVELAEGLGLGANTFCGPLWSTFLNLLCIFKADKNDQLFLYRKIRNYLSDLEVYHQYSYWENFRKFCLEHYGPLDRRTFQADYNFVKFDKLFLWTD